MYDLPFETVALFSFMDFLLHYFRNVKCLLGCMCKKFSRRRNIFKLSSNILTGDTIFVSMCLCLCSQKIKRTRKKRKRKERKKT